ncbi:hypothetical protein SAICODRAFT_69095 [Saitoella complicata NRRL Y-17804]|uniref:Endoplasmic reticulum junction formation protein lunapark n=1 Tax=Saitoella complicata (strain BCRC 22490 / CBS 7301 / JCM 7358 / NBRC 10748 / NRRL Y-17804) TaxID=698492 RepID=A0A0E9N8P1_SAICN|nr:uncharacterized protein SAICODRAFT_69095 [Saitoella complicata NRRL Y-17804]ODQ55770.1 hypothetical protein SAICODRAFT_69095 [Saitoella complicata NRRL Y-17804]GAO46189.1 hypothetical protein G7K_0426-t1 [Saitoella complicata NRRL Y-17804]
MPSLWPWKKEDDYEKILSELATKIQKHDTALSLYHSRLRRYRALWSFYSIVAYVIYVVLFVLVVGKRPDAREEWGAWAKKASVILVGPGVVYGVRNVLGVYYSRRISSEETQLLSLRSQQSSKIEELKTKTNFYSTQSLVQRYENAAAAANGTSPKNFIPKKGAKGTAATPLKEATKSTGRASPASGGPVPRRMATKEGKIPTSSPRTPSTRAASLPTPTQLSPHPLSFGSSFGQSTSHPPAVLTPSASQQPPFEIPWYAHLMTLLIGPDDPAEPSSRYALICRFCAAHNGLAMPGEDVRGLRWGCRMCGGLNGPAPPAPVTVVVVPGVGEGKGGQGEGEKEEKGHVRGMSEGSEYVPSEGETTGSRGASPKM